MLCDNRREVFGQHAQIRPFAVRFGYDMRREDARVRLGSLRVPTFLLSVIQPTPRKRVLGSAGVGQDPAVLA
jgi:hypothetical protein